MSTNASGTEKRIAQELIAEADPKVVKRAQWEAFEFSLEAPGIVQVRNESHADPSDHEYLVNVEGDTPTACDCPAFEYQGGACKHLIAVHIPGDRLTVPFTSPRIFPNSPQPFEHLLPVLFVIFQLPAVELFLKAL